jgi:hypothetical protein
LAQDLDAVLADDLDGEGGLADNESFLQGVEAMPHGSHCLVLSHVLRLQSVQNRGSQDLGVSVRGLAGLDDRAQIVHPVEAGLVAFEAGQEAVHAVGPLADGFCEFGADELGSVFGRQLVAVLVLQKGKVFLDVISEDQDVRVLASESQQFLAVEVPNFIVVVLSGRGVTFMRRTEYALVVSAAMITKSLPLMAMRESILKYF